VKYSAEQYSINRLDTNVKERGRSRTAKIALVLSWKQILMLLLYSFGEKGIFSLLIYAQNYWVFRLCPSFGILKTRKCNASETGSVSVLRCGGDTCSIGSLRNN
jgi:hypothetical protein